MHDDEEEYNINVECIHQLLKAGVRPKKYRQIWGMKQEKSNFNYKEAVWKILKGAKKKKKGTIMFLICML